MWLHITCDRKLPYLMYTRIMHYSLFQEENGKKMIDDHSRGLME